MKKRKIIEIPHDLRLLLRECQQSKKKPNTIKYSLSLSDSEIDKAKSEITNFMIEPKFKELLFKYIDRTNLKDSQVYKQAQVDRRVFSKIKNEDNYHPSKETIIKLALSLKLNLEELNNLLKSANYSLPENTYFNIAIIYCFRNKIYDIDQVNDILHACDLSLLTK